MNARVSTLPPQCIAWQPFPGRQTAFVTCPVEDVFFGGARGPGKSQGLLGKALVHIDRYAAAARVLVLRQSYPQLEQLEQRMEDLFPRFGGRPNRQRHTWRFPNGARLAARYLETEDDAREYQGHQYTLILPDELTEWATLRPIDKLRACLRSTDRDAHAARVLCQMAATGNPGGPGHNAVKFRFIDQQPHHGTPFRACASCDLRYREDREPACECQPAAHVDRVFIPSTLRDNPLLCDDPQYRRQLVAAANGDQALLDAWLNGNWDITSGGMFDDLWRLAEPVIEPFPIPAGWYVDRAFDPGSTDPYCALWFAEANGESVRLPDGRERHWPAGTLFVIGEDYGWTGRPNEGLRLPPAAVAERLRATEARLMAALGLREPPRPGPADTALWDVRGGACEADQMAQAGVTWTRAAKGPGSRVAGWQRLRQLLLANCEVDPTSGRVGPRTARMEQPGLFVFTTCANVIRTVPALPRDARDRDDVNTRSEDHCGDVLRYRCLAQGHSGGGASDITWG